MKRLLILFLSLLGLFTVATVDAADPASDAAVTITVSNRVTHQMLSGVGASRHSISHPPVSHGGSAFGGSPPVVLQHERLWTSMEKQAAWLGLKFIRAEIDWRWKV